MGRWIIKAILILLLLGAMVWGLSFLATLL